MSEAQPNPEQSRRRVVASALGVVVLLAVLALTWWIDGRGDADTEAAAPTTTNATFVDGSAMTGAARSRTESPTTADLPARVRRTLAYIDSGDWPAAADAPGTRGGDTFRNNERRLPTRGADGKRLTYREWDVNPKKRGRGRDAERIVTGSDGSAYYTLDHYDSFTKIRGPSA